MEPDACELEPRGDRAERDLVRDGEDDGMGAARELSACLARGVNDLGCLDAAREVGADDDVVGEVILRSPRRVGTGGMLLALSSV